MKNNSGGINMGALVFAAIGFVSLILAVFAYSSRENNDFAETKKLISEVAGEIGKIHGIEHEIQSLNRDFDLMVERVIALESKPVPHLPPAPVINIPKEITIKAGGAIPVRLIERAGIVPPAATPIKKVEVKRKAVSK